MLWVGFTLLLILIVAALVRPMLGKGQSLSGGTDTEVYASQLAEIEADKERGLIDEESATAARAEVGRRLLRSDKADRNERRNGSAVKFAILAIIVVVPAITISLYGLVGAPTYQDQPLSARVAPITTEQLDTLLARAEERLSRNPDDAQGWLAVAPIYQRQRRFKDAADAYGRINTLLGDNAEWLGLQGENLTFANEGVVSEEAERLFERALEVEFAAIRPRIFLAIAARQQGDFIEAGERWGWLIDRSDGTERWLTIANAEFARMSGQLPANPEQGDATEPPAEAGTAVRGPTDAQVAAAADMPADAQQAMIEGMIQRLADRLEAEGGTPAEWLQLVRAHRVMGEEEKAVEALTAALAAHPDARAEFMASPETEGLTIPESAQ